MNKKLLYFFFFFCFRVKLPNVNNYRSCQGFIANKNYSFLYSAQLKTSIETWREKHNHWNKCEEGRKTAPTGKTFSSCWCSSSLPKRRGICFSIETMKYCLMFVLLSLMQPYVKTHFHSQKNEAIMLSTFFFWYNFVLTTFWLFFHVFLR